MFDFESRKSTLISAFSLLLLATGLYGSLKVVIGLFGIEADTSHSLMLWQGVREHGIVWIRDWLFTPDNWLLSLFPFHFVGFLIFGPKVSVVIIFGWLIFVFSAFISGAIAWRVGAKKASIIIFLSLLNFGLYAHTSGWASYSTSHNITNLFGLASILILINWSIRPNNFILLLLLAVLVSGAVSDPWMLAAYNLPILLVSLWFLARPTTQISRAQSAKLLTVAIISILSVQTRLFGILSFLPSMHFSPGDWLTLNSNSVYLVKDFGGLLNLIPFSNSNEFLPGLLSILILLAFLQHSVFEAIRVRLHISDVAFSYFGVVLFSVGGMTSAFVISSVAAQNYSARFLINCAYLIVITIGVLAELNWKHSSAASRYVLALILGLFVSSGLISNFNYLASRDFKFKDTGVSDSISFLKENGLSYGYGPYWGSNANAVTAASMSRIRIRPVVFTKNTGMMVVGNRPQSSKRWYTVEDIPEGVKEYFVIVKSDGEECPKVDVCLAGLEKQFGRPIRTIKRGDSTVLVWDHSLIGYETPPINVERNRIYFFNESGEFPNGQGWSHPEPWGTWTEGNTALIRLKMGSHINGDGEMNIEGHAFLSEKHKSQIIGVIVNGHSVAKLNYDLSINGGLRKVRIPHSIILERNGALDIQFSINEPKSPLELGMSVDSRKLGLGLISLSFR